MAGAFIADGGHEAGRELGVLFMRCSLAGAAPDEVAPDPATASRPPASMLVGGGTLELAAAPSAAPMS